MRCCISVAVLAAGCNQLLGIPEVEPGACELDAAFADVTPIAGLDSQLGVQHAQLSRDELILVLSRVTVAYRDDAPVPRYGDLYVARRDHRSERFHDVVALDTLNTELDEQGASLSDDRQTLYFGRRVESQRYQIFAAQSSGPGQFGEPAALDLGGDSRSDVEPFVTPNAIYFASRRPDGSSSLYTARGRGTSFAAPQPVLFIEDLPPPAAYGNPVVSANGLAIYYSAPADNASPPDIWVARRSATERPFGQPRRVTELNTISAERPTWISEDSCRLYFVTNRAGDGFRLWMGTR
jgi:hypothetical protein